MILQHGQARAEASFDVPRGAKSNLNKVVGGKGIREGKVLVGAFRSRVEKGTSFSEYPVDPDPSTLLVLPIYCTLT